MAMLLVTQLEQSALKWVRDNDLFGEAKGGIHDPPIQDAFV